MYATDNVRQRPSEFADMRRAALMPISGRKGHVYKPHANLKSMEIAQIVALLVAERDRLNDAIEALQGPTKRRGRPPKNPLSITAPIAAPAPRKKRRKFSAAQREAAAERMRQRWAAKKKASAKVTKKPVTRPKKTAKAG